MKPINKEDLVSHSGDIIIAARIAVNLMVERFVDGSEKSSCSLTMFPVRMQMAECIWQKQFNCRKLQIMIR